MNLKPHTHQLQLNREPDYSKVEYPYSYVLTYGDRKLHIGEVGRMDALPAAEREACIRKAASEVIRLHDQGTQQEIERQRSYTEALALVAQLSPKAEDGRWAAPALTTPTPAQPSRGSLWPRAFRRSS